MTLTISEGQDIHGSYLLIAIPQNAGKDISDICGTLVNGHMEVQKTFVPNELVTIRRILLNKQNKNHFVWGSTHDVKPSQGSSA